MSDQGETRIYIDWQRVRPRTFSGWLTLALASAVGLAVLVLAAIVASTVLLIALAAALVSAVLFLLTGLLRRGRARRDVTLYRDDDNARN